MHGMSYRPAHLGLFVNWQTGAPQKNFESAHFFVITFPTINFVSVPSLAPYNHHREDRRRHSALHRILLSISQPSFHQHICHKSHTILTQGYLKTLPVSGFQYPEEVAWRALIDSSTIQLVDSFSLFIFANFTFGLPPFQNG